MASENWASWKATFEARKAKLDACIAELQLKKASAEDDKDPEKAKEYQKEIDNLNHTIHTVSSRILNLFAMHKTEHESPQKQQAPASIESDEENISPRAKISLG